ncbi:hypothetical protein KFE25_005109 [Diacronema lutheri]|uniref:Uncharacterized protein n=1 Tax=Diacronema lutheri TaxID=2081491 RepID=A0A8J5XBW7_DIALT|nr:hypothetical protein KFE25_005109 [Diacronema lutheri]
MAPPPGPWASQLWGVARSLLLAVFALLLLSSYNFSRHAEATSQLASRVIPIAAGTFRPLPPSGVRARTIAPTHVAPPASIAAAADATNAAATAARDAVARSARWLALLRGDSSTGAY